MPDSVETFNRALLWIAITGLASLVWIYGRARTQKQDPIFSHAHTSFFSSQVTQALLFTCLAVVILDFFSMPLLSVLQMPSEQANATTIPDYGYALPDGSVMVIQVHGIPDRQPANGLGEWHMGQYVFSSDAQTTIQAHPGQEIAACLIQERGGPWKATVITSASNAPTC